MLHSSPLQSHPAYTEASCHAFVCDLTADKLSDTIPEGSVNLASMIFVLSAIAPEKMVDALRNVLTVGKAEKMSISLE